MVRASRNLYKGLASRDVALAVVVQTPRDGRAVLSKADGVFVARSNLHKGFASRDVALAVAVKTPRDGHAVCSKADVVVVARSNLHKGLANRDVALALRVAAPRDGRAVFSKADGVVVALGLREDGTAIAWGGNSQGQCDVPAGETFVQVACGAFYTVGLTLDSDGDGYSDGVDAFPNDPNEWADSDGDGMGDNGDPCPNDPDNDIDGDGVCGADDAFPNDPNEWADSDGDGMGDNEDLASVGACCVSSGCHQIAGYTCTALGGTWLGEGGSCDDCPASCAGDTDGNGVVNIEDLLNMLGSWGPCP